MPINDKIAKPLFDFADKIKDQIPLLFVDKIKLHFIWNFNLNVNRSVKDKLNSKNKW